MKPVDPVTKTIYQFAVTALVLLPYVLIKTDILSLKLTAAEVARILVLAVVMTSLGYFAYYFLIERLPVRSVAILSYFDPAVAVFASAFILREPTSVYSYIGAALIFAASIASELHSGKADISADDIEQR